MRKRMAGLLPALGLALVSATVAAEAQVCAGTPTRDGQVSLGASAYFPEDLDQYGVEAGYDVDGPLSVFAGLSVVSQEGGESENVVAAGAAYRLPVRDGVPGAGGQVCPVAGVSYNNVQGVGTATSVSLGLGLGGTLSGGRGVAIHPYAVPQVVFGRFDPDDESPFGGEEQSESRFAVSGGVLAAFGPWWVGPVVSHVFTEGADPTFGIRAGVRL